jgi:hypothetical protein
MNEWMNKLKVINKLIIYIIIILIILVIHFLIKLFQKNLGCPNIIVSFD